LLSSELGCDASHISDFELCLYDTQGAVIGGALDEFIFSARLDNLMSSFCALHALLETSTEASLANEKRVRLIALFDHEEVGSDSQQGAGSTMFEHFLKRITTSGGNRDLFEISMRKSFLISSDMAHACHPNYPEKHDPNHKPEFHKGPVIKLNSNQRYATNSVTASLIHEIAKRHSVPLQDFVVRNDSLCGSTIGPILSTFGVRTIDVGNPQLSMHSIREICAVDDVSHAVNLFKGFFDEVTLLDESFHIE